MGTIITDVKEKHINIYPDEEEFLKPFLAGFDVTYGVKRVAFTTQLSVYILKPEDFIKEAYGINHRFSRQ